MGPRLRSAAGRARDWLDGTPLLVGAALGLAFGDATGGHGTAWVAPVVAVAAAGGVAILVVVALPSAQRIAVALLAASIGNIAAYRVARPHFPSQHVAAAPLRVPIDVEGILTADPVGDARPRLSIAVERLDDGRGWRPANGYVSLTLRRATQVWMLGDRVRGTVALRRPRNFGNPGEFDYEGYMARRGVYVTAFAEDDSGLTRAGHAHAPAADALAAWRRGVDALFRDTLPAPQAAVLGALIVGNESALPSDTKTAFSRAGVSHVLSISGLHIGLVAAAGYAMFRWLVARSRWLLLTVNVPKLSVGLSVIPVLLYAGIAGSNVATTRAVLMILVFLGAVLVDRQRHVLVSLAVAAIAILLYSPGASLDISFQLSFVAVAGLVLAMQRFWPWWREWEEARLMRLRGWRGRVLRTVALSAVVSLSALAATTPLTAFHFNQISLVAPVANAVVVPLLGSAAVTLGLLAAVAYIVSASLAQWFVVVAGPFVQLGLWCVDLLAAAPFAALRVVTPTLLELALIYAGLLTLVCFSGRARLFTVSVVALALLGDGTWWYWARYHRSDLRVTFLSIGQGDSAVVELPGAAVMVIDGGGLGGDSFDVGERVIAPFLWSRKIARVDYLVLSHPESDHYGGLRFLAEHFSPREFWSNGTSATSAQFARLERALMDHDVQRIVLHRGDRRLIDGTEVIVQSPPARLDGLTANNRSLVVSIACGAQRVLFTGDIEAPEEADLVAHADGTLASTILKIPHHGSHTSSSAPFLDMVTPRLAVVSAGFENRFGFPHREVIERYAARRCPVVRTDLDGAVQVGVNAAGIIDVQRYRDGAPDGP